MSDRIVDTELESRAVARRWRGLPPELEDSLARNFVTRLEFDARIKDLDTRSKVAEINSRRLSVSIRDLRKAVDKLSEELSSDRAEEWKFRYGSLEKGSANRKQDSDAYHQARSGDYTQAINWLMVGGIAAINIILTIVLTHK